MSSQPAGPVSPRRRRPSALSRESIIRAAIGVIDLEGVQALSMRRLAQAMDVGTMSLYYYVRTKDELLALVDDALMGEQILASSTVPPDDWRAALTELAVRSCEAFKRHPWRLAVLGGITHRGALGANGLRHLEQSLAAAGVTGLPLRECLNIVQLVDNYVVGHVLRTAGKNDTEQREIGDVISVSVADGSYPLISALFGDAGEAASSTVRFESYAEDDHAFLRGLGVLMDGIAAEVDRYRSSATSSR
ncbi:TetR/AcrR family transcriptional regulator [Subtercola sp. YIM 133946]|uniref:TetR/AcrR family transcriptional regulator n=1 Tax=Subtercola sp. YIM 133946 TaxID=3118909 RepID=UPI002F9538B4